MAQITANIRERNIIRASAVGIGANVALCGAKAAIGLISNSIAIILDALNNLSDALSSVLVLAGISLANKPANREHPFGFGRFEYLTTLTIALIILGTGVFSLVQSFDKALNPEPSEYGWAGVSVLVLAIGAKLLLSRYYRRQGEANESDTLKVTAGDALFVQSLEFPMAKLKDIAPANVLRAMHIFAKAIGPSGVCGGQVLDIDAAKAKDEPDYVRRIAKLKTGALIQASVLTGAALGGADEAALSRYADYAAHLGSAFQIVDDILDVTSTAEELGKTPGKDERDGKVTHVVGMPHHFSWATKFATGDNVNDLTPNVGDPNSWIPEYKAFLVNLEPVA